MNLVNKFLSLPALDPLRDELSARLFPYRSVAMLAELSAIPATDCGVDSEGFPFIILHNGVKLYGRQPSNLERKIYRYWKHRIASRITEETIRVALDVILRYKYPHALPNLVPPYPRARRSFFHPQHKETIWDFPNYSDAEKKTLAEKFSPQHGETFMDVGAYIGFGVVRMAGEIGVDGRIVAVEADPIAFEILKKNIASNHLTNVTLIPKAVGEKEGTSFFFKTERQANSLIADVVNSKDGIRVEVDTIDNILHSNGIDTLDRLSVTINGAEVEAINGATQTLKNSPRLKISLAGWYSRDGKKICELVSPRLNGYGFQIAIGAGGGVLAWK